MTSTSVTKEQDALIDRLLEGYHGDPKEQLGKDGLLRACSSASWSGCWKVSCGLT